MEEIKELLEKYNNFAGEQLRSIQQLEDGSKILNIAILDDEGEDLEIISLEFTDINASKILIDSVLPMMDMMSGICIIEENKLFGFALGRGEAMLHVHNAPLYIIASKIRIL